MSWEVKRAGKDRQCWGAGIPSVGEKIMPTFRIPIECKRTNPRDACAQDGSYRVSTCAGEDRGVKGEVLLWKRG